MCATTLALLGCPPTPYSHFVWDATKVLSLPLSKILDFYQAPRSLPDYYYLTPPIVLAAVFHQLRFTLAEVNQLDGCQSGTRTHDPLINSQMLLSTELSGAVTRQQVPFLKPVGGLPNQNHNKLQHFLTPSGACLFQRRFSFNPIKFALVLE